MRDARPGARLGVKLALVKPGGAKPGAKPGVGAAEGGNSADERDRRGASSPSSGLGVVESHPSVGLGVVDSHPSLG